MWQRDALRRLCRKEQLSEDDYAALIIIAKDNENEAEAMPLKQEHVPSPDAVNTSVNLKSIRESEHVNALESGQVLSFEKGSGITIIYGDNGSGKSGYARILKSACRARMRDKDKQAIRPNIYSSSPGTPKATINFSVNEQNQKAEWVQNQETDARLSAVSVFDSNTANVHVDEDNDVAYTPFPLELLRRLSVACDEMKRRLEKEVNTLEAQTPHTLKNSDCEQETEVGKIVYALKTTTDKETIEQLATISAEEESEYDRLKVDIASDPEKTVRKLLSEKTKLETCRDELSTLQAALQSKELEDIKSKQTVYEAKKAAAEAAANDLFKEDEEILPSLGAETWRALWQAARLYSQQDAYAEKSFPYTEEGAKCVLCQQDLSAEAAERLNSFETFVKDEARCQEDKAKRDYETALNELKQANCSIHKVTENYRAIRDQVGNEELAESYRKSFVQAKCRARAFLKNQESEVADLPELLAAPDYKATLEDLQKRIDDLSAEKNSPRRKTMIEQYNELKDRIWLKLVKDDFIAEIDRKKSKDALEALIDENKTTAITKKSSELAKHLVTDALRAEFDKEVSKLPELKNLAIELKQANSKAGTPYFRVALTSRPEERKLSAILSEGEFRCIALATFLAEQATTESKSTLVLDDPVCSLDHMHRTQVAERLAKEGSERQVVIFTHDLAFLFLLEEACREQKTKIAYRSVLKRDSKIGLCESDAPTRAQSVDKALESLENDLSNQKFSYENGDDEEWSAAISRYQSALRNLWERAVEDSLSPVVKRFRNKVDTLGLSKVTVLTIKDCDTMREGYGRCSRSLHSDGDALNLPTPKPEGIQEQIDAIKNWIKSVKSRQKKIKEVA